MGASGMAKGERDAGMSAPRRPPRWLSLVVGVLALVIIFIDHPFQRGLLNSIVLACAVGIIAIAVAFQWWTRERD